MSNPHPQPLSDHTCHHSPPCTQLTSLLFLKYVKLAPITESIFTVSSARIILFLRPSHDNSVTLFRSLLKYLLRWEYFSEYIIKTILPYSLEHYLSYYADSIFFFVLVSEIIRYILLFIICFPQ